MTKSDSPKQKVNLPASVRDSLKTHDGSKAMVKRLYEENSSLKSSLSSTQDELENWRTKYHESDKQVSILDVQVRSSVLAEIVKFLLSTIAAGLGVNLLTNGNYWLGGGLLALAVILYVGIVALGKKT